ncbi:MAG: GNAT family N-acetyltransferase [Caldilineaceae bacterium]|nr:GNAT family N-acetyltransferase [Caldilineaceae bacterium]
MTHDSLRPIDPMGAQSIVGWRYTGPYSFYNTDPQRAAATLDEFLRPELAYHGVYDKKGALIGFCCFGEAARVPGGNYSEIGALDIGLGLRPDLTGKGLGTDFLGAILGFAEVRYAPTSFRATIALFNQRSRRLFAHAGFEERARFFADN